MAPHVYDGHVQLHSRVEGVRFQQRWCDAAAEMNPSVFTAVLYPRQGAAPPGTPIASPPA